ncbi:four-carbon acid sugar kinase family protein [Halothiobacillus sp.]|uniref:four-carbon acid sugar kinase family protein n=1 Tax=Halothiobacillus sp. TaxID=1891311 RepID=UPI002AD49226|nr:four-carbon acid sugar kinase family protein [Halothiobacillus sp.]
MQTKIIALDDDPTGSQTVHGCLLLTRWDEATLLDALDDSSPLFFVLTNTRGMDAASAARVTRTVCQNLNAALKTRADAGNPINPILVSRSDSTLRGHYPVETDVIAEELGPFDAHFLVPAFIEAGRITRNSQHYLLVDGKPVPTHETEFARDSVFGYSTSYLPDYVAEKTAGRIPASEVTRFVLDEIRGGDIQPKLTALTGNACAVVDAETQDDLNRFARDVMAVAATGKRFLFRSAASLLTALAALPPQPIAATSMHRFVRGGKPGAVVVGSHVKKTSEQLAELLKEPNIAPIEVDIERIDADNAALVADVLAAAEKAFAAGKTSVIFTSRAEKTFADQAARLAFGERVSATLMKIVAGLPKELGWLISKGGITSNDVLSTGLNLKASRVLGQILTGCSVVRCPADHPRFPMLPVVIFPGNVGDQFAVAEACRRLRGA